MKYGGERGNQENAKAEWIRLVPPVVNPRFPIATGAATF